MPASRFLLAALLLLDLPAVAQERPPGVKPDTSAPPPVIACASLSNLRSILRKANDDPVAAVSVVAELQTSLNCGVLDRTSVTGLADHVALNGRAYDCVAVQNSSICRWTTAGSVKPSAVPTSTLGGTSAPTRPRR